MIWSRKVWLSGIFACLVTLIWALSWQGAGILNAQVPADANDWQRVPNVPADVDFRNVFMADASTGIAVGKQLNKGVAYQLLWTALGGGGNSLHMTPVDFS